MSLRDARPVYWGGYRPLGAGASCGDNTMGRQAQKMVSNFNKLVEAELDDDLIKILNYLIFCRDETKIYIRFSACQLFQYEVEFAPSSINRSLSCLDQCILTDLTFTVFTQEKTKN